MKIGEYGFMPNFNTVKQLSQVVAPNSNGSTDDIAVKSSEIKSSEIKSSEINSSQPKVTLDLSEDGQDVARRAQNKPERDFGTASGFTANNFNTEETEANQVQNDAGNAVLDQYRFFVPNTQFQSEDGVVKRIFK